MKSFSQLKIKSQIYIIIIPVLFVMGMAPVVHNYINGEKEKKRTIKDQTQEILYYNEKEMMDLTHLIEEILQENNKKIIENNYSEEQKNMIQQDVLDLISNIRFKDGESYFWITDAQLPIPTMIMHPEKTYLNGRPLESTDYNVVGESKENLFSHGVRIAREKGEGTFRYVWNRSTDVQHRDIQPKMGYSFYYKPWGWVISTSVYLSDIEKK